MRSHSAVVWPDTPSSFCSSTRSFASASLIFARWFAVRSTPSERRFHARVSPSETTVLTISRFFSGSPACANSWRKCCSASCHAACSSLASAGRASRAIGRNSASSRRMRRKGGLRGRRQSTPPRHGSGRAGPAAASRPGATSRRWRRGRSGPRGRWGRCLPLHGFLELGLRARALGAVGQPEDHGDEHAAARERRLEPGRGLRRRAGLAGARRRRARRGRAGTGAPRRGGDLGDVLGCARRLMIGPHSPTRTTVLPE